MRWLLLTGTDNPGDVWARFGIIELIRTVDADARFTEINKLSDAPTHDFGCERVVFCGQPLLWSHASHNTTQAEWWEFLNHPDILPKLIIAGFGICYGCDMEGNIVTQDRETTLEEVRKLLASCRAAYCRSSLGVDELPGVPVHPCPSIFAGRWLQRKRTTKLCNFMHNGGHNWGLSEDQMNAWMELAPHLSHILMDRGFQFICHHQSEWEMAVDIYGWPEDRIIKPSSNPMETLWHYSKATHYFGNRVHGGIVARSFGADSIVVGLDSRRLAAKQVGAKALIPSEIGLDGIARWAQEDAQYQPLQLDLLARQQLKYFA